MNEPSYSNVRALDVAIAALLGALATAAFVATNQGRLFGDGFYMLQLLEWQERPWWRTWAHPLHTPVAEFFGALGLNRIAHDNFLLASSVPAGLGAAAVFLASRFVGAGRTASVLVAALAAAAPAVWFFATILEVHALHFGVVALAILATLAAARRTSARMFLAVHGALFFLVALSHISAATLVPVWALLGWYARVDLEGARMEARPVDRRAVVRAALPHAVLAAVLFGAALGISEFTYRRFGEMQGVGQITDMIGGSVEPTRFAYYRDDWIRPLGWLGVPLAAALIVAAVPALRRSATAAVRGWLLVTFGGLVVPFVFYSYWSLPNDGGYLAGWLPFAAIAAAQVPGLVRAVPVRSALLVSLGVLLALQVRASLVAVDAHRPIYEAAGGPRRLATCVELLPHGGLVIGIDTLGRPLRWDAPGIEELDLIRVLAGRPEEEYASRIGAALDERALVHPGPYMLDASYRSWLYAGSPFEYLINTFERELVQRFQLEVVADSAWPAARLTSRRP